MFSLAGMSGSGATALAGTAFVLMAVAAMSTIDPRLTSNRFTHPLLVTGALALVLSNALVRHLRR